MLPPEMKRHLRKLSDSIVKQSNKPQQNIPRHSIEYGVISVIDVGPPVTLEVNVGGAAVASKGIRYLSSYVPTVGDTVMMSWYGTDLVVLGSIGGTSALTGIVLGHTFAIQGTIVATTATTSVFMYVPVPAGQKVTMVGYSISLEAGTCTVDFQDSGTNITGATGISVTTTDLTVTTGINHSISANHKIGINITVPSGASTIMGTVHLRYGS